MRWHVHRRAKLGTSSNLNGLLESVNAPANDFRAVARAREDGIAKPSTSELVHDVRQPAFGPVSAVSERSIRSATEAVKQHHFVALS